MVANSIAEMRSGQQKDVTTRFEETQSHIIVRLDKLLEDVTTVKDDLQSVKLMLKQLLDQDNQQSEITYNAAEASMADDLLPKLPRRDAVEDVSDAKSNEILVKTEAESRKIVSPEEDHKVFDDLSQPNFTATTTYKLNDEGLNVYCGSNSFPGNFYSIPMDVCTLNSQTWATFDQILGNSKDEALRLLNKSTKQSFTEIDGDRCYIPLIDFVPRVFDPGTLIINGDLGDAAMLNMHLLSFCMNNELPHPIFIATVGYKLLEKTSDVDSWLNSQTESTLNLRKTIKSVLKGFPNGNDNSTLLIECVLQVFYPGIDVIGSISTNGLKFDGRTSWLVLASLGGYKCFADCSKNPNHSDVLDYDLGTGSAIVLMRKTNYRISKTSEKEKSEMLWAHAVFTELGGQGRSCVRNEDQLEVLVVSCILLAADLAAKVELHSVLGMYTKEVEVLVPKTITILLFPLIKSRKGQFKEDTLDGLHIIRQVYDTLVDVLDEGFSTAILIIDMEDMVWDPGILYNCHQNIFRRVGFVISNEMQQGHYMVEKSRIYTIRVDRHIRVGDLSWTYEGATVLADFVWAVGQADRLRDIISTIKAGGSFRWLQECCSHFGYDIWCKFFSLSHAVCWCNFGEHSVLYILGDKDGF